MTTDVLFGVPLARVEPGDWDWTAWGTIATAVAAIVTAVTVVFVAFQTRATRKAANEAKRSADAANSALDYARQQHLQSLYMTAETVKARIDSEMPRLLIEEAKVLPEWTVDGGSPPPEAFFEPADRRRQIQHRIRIRIKNDGPRSAKLLFSEPMKYQVNGETEGIQQHSVTKDSVPVGIGETLVGEFTLARPAAFWMDAHASRAQGRVPDDYPQFFIRYLTDADTGAHENHTITLSGEALKPDATQNGRWFHRPENEFNGETSEFGAFVEPARRMYFLSRVRNEALPELSWEEISRTPQPHEGPTGASAGNPGI
ncbi:hypothetical protein ACX5I6_20995 [Arthrobacter sp. MMS24-T111]